MSSRPVVSVLTGLGFISACWLHTQVRADKPLAFEVVSIKKATLPQGATGIFYFRNADPTQRSLKASGNRFNRRRATLNDLIVDAYDVNDYQILGLPKWGLPNNDLYDIDARSEGDAVPSSDQLREMLRTMLADRFQLKLHKETREFPVYFLAVGKGGVKLKEVPPEDPNKEKQQASGATRPVRSFDSTANPAPVLRGKIGDIVQLASNFLDHPLIDKTGLTARYEFVWNEQELREEARSGKPAPSIFPMMRQFGLNLQATKAPINVVVIDKAEKPSQN